MMRWCLLFGVLALLITEMSAAHLIGCFEEDELLGRANKFLQRSKRHVSVPVDDAAAAKTCKDFEHNVYSAELKHRSLSPWSYTRTEADHNIIPSSYAEANCLCDGCIINGTENTDYNSVPVEEYRLFLRRVPCPHDPKKYSAKVEYIKVRVGCTCVVPKQASHRG